MKNNKLPNLVSILILTLLTVIVWISLSIYRALTLKPVAPVSQDISQPLNPSLDTDTINKIESRIYLNDSQIPDNVITVVAATPVAQKILITPSPIASPSAITPSPVASASATP